MLNQLIEIFYNDEFENDDKKKNLIEKSEKIKIKPILNFDKFVGCIKLEVEIKNSKKSHKIKNLSEFYTRMLNNKNYKYEENFEFVHCKDAFDAESQGLLNFVMKYAEIINYANSNSNSNFRYHGQVLSESNIIIGNSAIDDLFDVLNGKKVEFKRDFVDGHITFLDENPKIKFVLEKKCDDNYVFYPDFDINDKFIFTGKSYTYLLDNKNLYRCTNDIKKTTLKLLEIFKHNYFTEIKFKEDELPDFFTVIMPKMENSIIFKNISKEEIKKNKPQELVSKMFLDFDKNGHLVADLRFCYGKNEFNPITQNVKNTFLRNKFLEDKKLNILIKSGFMLDTKNSRFILPNDDDIYNFISKDIDFYTKNFEVMVTENFKTKQIRTPKINGIGVKVENDLLSIDLSKIDIDINELKNVLEKYSLKKKYYRLKDGSFIDLQNNKEVEFLDKLITGMGIDYSSLNSTEIQLPVNRSLYLNQLLEKLNGTEVLKNKEYDDLINNLNHHQLREETVVPKSLKTDLRYYQKTGFQWLKTLDAYHFGGILADDMGLGKTIQMLAVIVDYVENGGEKASLVISPGSLTLNWLSEVNKFTKNLKTCVIRGNAETREDLIENIENYNLIITSYDLLKRDIDLYIQKGYKFRFVIADEAQYLKNSTTKNAKSIKKLKADTKFALTGTPIENSLAELWSIFDFVMNGYLFNYRKFKRCYEVPIVKNNDEVAMQKLKMLIEPFILRRNKKEVLTELPDKTVTILKNEMTEEQQEVYLSYLAQAKHSIEEKIEADGFEHSHMQILAALTRLRQICCHPSLFLEDYDGGSSKLNQCIEIVQEAVNAGHKILLFSGYTSMLKIIEAKLKEKNISYAKLTGATKMDTRIDLVNEFNNTPDINVFLISLKVGGTGLNLTGADVVIHYDPWWNVSTENQATDRAYRIGQKNNVQVYKLITENSIEEKIFQLQKKKAKLVESTLDTRTRFINQLSKDEVMNLFE